jgi:AcrR family transcriptional regulator
MTAPYLRIAGDIAARIQLGELRPGDRVPSTRQITRDWGVAIATATKVMAELQERGLVRAVPGVGSVVATAPTIKAPPVEPARKADAERSREAVVRIAIRIADAEGLGALSMRRIAADLGVATMSLYRWVPSKEALLLEVLNTLLGEGRWPDPPPPGWRAQLEYLARRQWTAYQAHPWLASVISMGRPQYAPDAMMHTEWALRSVAGLGLDSETMLFIALTVIGHTRGVALSLEAEAQAQRDTGTTIDDWMKAQDAKFATAFGSGRYPMLAALDGSPDIDFTLENMFEFGLTIILDGVGHLIDTAAAKAATRPDVSAST